MQRHDLTKAGFVLFFSLALLAGCEQGSPTDAVTDRATETPDAVAGSAESEPDSEASSTQQATVEVPLAIKSWNQVQEWIKGQQGKVVVVDVWSTYCLPCMKEFPHFVEFHEQYRDRVACASLSVDFYSGEGNQPEEVQPQVLKFLKSKSATMENFISSDPDDTVLQQISTVAIPAVLVYDRSGTLCKVFNNDDSEYGPKGFSYQQDIVPFVDQLLEEK